MNYVLGFAALICSVPISLALMAWSRPDTADAIAKVVRSLEPIFIALALALTAPRLLIGRLPERWRGRRRDGQKVVDGDDLAN